MLSEDRKRFLIDLCAKLRGGKYIRLTNPARNLDERAEFDRTLRSLRGLATLLHSWQEHVREHADLYTGKEVGSIVYALLSVWPAGDLGGRLRSVESLGTASDDIRKEHDLPVSFFRDVLRGQHGLTVDEWHYLLARFMRVRRIASCEDEALMENGHRQSRPEDAYAQAGITMTADSRATEARFDEAVAKYFGGAHGPE